MNLETALNLLGLGKAAYCTWAYDQDIPLIVGGFFSCRRNLVVGVACLWYKAPLK